MQIINPLHLNGLKINTFLRIILSIQLAFWGTIGLDEVGIQIPIIRQLVSFIYLIFIPGYVILRIFKLHKLGNIETILYSVGLSIGTLMFTGAFINTIFPFFGIYRPISNMLLIIAISVIVLILCVLCYAKDENFSEPVFINVRDILSSPALFLCLIPFLAIFGTYLFNFYQNNTLQMIMIVVISAVVILIGFNCFIPKKLYPLAILMITISLLLHSSLITMYIFGYDIHYEYYTSNLVITNSFWDSTISSSVNGMLSIVMFAPIFSGISGMNLAWVFKIVFPLLFALLPLGLFQAFQKQTNDKIAFLACFFFVSVATFYTEMLTLARQQIAELFLVLLILLIIDENMNKVSRSILFIIFSTSLIVSHYGLSYIYLLVLILAWAQLVLFESTCVQKFVGKLCHKFNRGMTDKNSDNKTCTKPINMTITTIYVLFYTIFSISWFMYISNSSSFNSIVNIINHILSSVNEDILNPEAAQGLTMMMSKTQPTVLSLLNKIINYLNQIFIIVGIITVLIQNKMKFKNEYIALSVSNLALLFAGVSLPFFASALNMTRLYHITIIFLALFGVIGGMKIIMILIGKKRMRHSLKILSIYFVIFFLYQTGFVHGVVEGKFYTPTLNSSIDYPRFNEQEILGAEWLYSVKDNKPIYADDYRHLLIVGYEGRKARSLPSDFGNISKHSYIYFGTFNIIKNKVNVVRTKGVSRTHEYVDSDNIVNDRNRIYDNDGTHIYY